MFLTNDQKNAVNNINKFLKNDTQIYYLLDGSAGTGKTHLMKTLFSESNNVILAAPTHKAAKVLSKKVDKRVYTIHQILKYKAKYNNNGDTIFYQDKETNGKCIYLNNDIPDVRDFNVDESYIIVIDEASMISEELFNKLIKINNKILFIGDHYQLPPVNELESKVFNFVKNKSTLIEIVRTGNNLELANIHNFFRNCVKNIDIPKEEFRKLISKPKIFLKKIDKCLKNNQEFVITCYTNERRREWIRYCISRLQYFYNTMEEYIPSMQLILMSTLLYDDIILHKFDTFIIKQVEKQIISIKELGEINYFNLERGITIYKLTCIDLEEQTRIFYKVISKDYQYFMTKAIEKKKIIKGWIKKSEESKKQIQELWTEYWNNFNKYETYLTPYFAITIHSSQGSTIEKVFVDWYDIFFNQKKRKRIGNMKEKCQLCYVAVSRSSKKINILAQKLDIDEYN